MDCRYNIQQIRSFFVDADEHEVPVPLPPLLVPIDRLNPSQRLVYDLVHDHALAMDPPPLRLFISGTAGTGKSVVINAIVHMLHQEMGADCVRLAAPTGIAAFNIAGCTLHSLFHIGVGPSASGLSSERLQALQNEFKNVRYLIVDEISMVGCTLMAKIDESLRLIFPKCAHLPFGGCSVILVGDPAQLPPVGDATLFGDGICNSPTATRGRAAFKSIDLSIVLESVMRQVGEDQATFRGLLLRLRSGQIAHEDLLTLNRRAMPLLPLPEHHAFEGSLRLFARNDDLDRFNFEMLQRLDRPVAVVKAVHTGKASLATSSEEAGGLEAEVCLAVGADVMLTANLDVRHGLFNGARGKITDLLFAPGRPPPSLPEAVIVQFATYSGPSLFADRAGIVPIRPIRRTCGSNNASGSRQQVPLALAWGITIHKSQGMTLHIAIVNIGPREFALGLTFVALSRVKSLDGLVLQDPLRWPRLEQINGARAHVRRRQDEQRLLTKSQLIFDAYVNGGLAVVQAMKL